VQLAGRNQLPDFKGRVIPGHRSELPQLPAMVERGKVTLNVLRRRGIYSMNFSKARLYLVRPAQCSACVGNYHKFV
jgi:hypothetical protein